MQQAERINPFPTTLFSVPTKSVQTEQANLFPTGVRRKIQHRTCVTRGSHGFAGNFDTVLPEINVLVGASIRH